MLNLPILCWGQSYESLESQSVVHFHTGQPLAQVSLASPGLIDQDLRQARRAGEILRAIPSRDLLQLMQRAADLFANASLPSGDGEQSPDDFIHQQSGSTGIPEHLCRANLEKNRFVMANIDRVLDALTRGLDLEILSRGCGKESRDVMVSYQAESPVLGMVLPSNSPGVHTLWLPAIAMQIGLALKPGSQEFWTPYRIVASLVAAGMPREAVSIYPGRSEIAYELINRCGRTIIFGNTETIREHAGNPRVQVHGPGFSKILLGDDVVDHWEQYLDLFIESVLANAGRGCINCSGIWASRHTNQIAEALAERLGPIEIKPPQDSTACLAAFTVPGRARAIHTAIFQKTKEDGVHDMTARFGPRLFEQERFGYLRPMVIHCDSPDREIANSEYMFPFVTIVECPQEQMLEKIGDTLVCTALTNDKAFERQLINSNQIDRLNIGPIPTTRLDWLQPHEGNLVNFLFRSRALQIAQDDLP